jgi:hypothetical protein
MAEKTKVHLCYCQIPEDKLKEIARLRFVQGIPTERLMKQLKTQKEKEYLAAIALLDVKLQDIPKTVSVDEPFILQHLLDCRGHVREMLEESGIEIVER